MKKIYAITDVHARFIKKMEFPSLKELQHYLNVMHAKGTERAAIELSPSKKKLSKAKIKKFENHIDNLKKELNNQDITHYKKLLKKLKEGPASEGMIIVNQYFDTFLRETIPDDVWTEMIGK